MAKRKYNPNTGNFSDDAAPAATQQAPATPPPAPAETTAPAATPPSPTPRPKSVSYEDTQAKRDEAAREEIKANRPFLVAPYEGSLAVAVHTYFNSIINAMGRGPKPYDNPAAPIEYAKNAEWALKTLRALCGITSLPVFSTDSVPPGTPVRVGAADLRAFAGIEFQFLKTVNPRNITRDQADKAVSLREQLISFLKKLKLKIEEESKNKTQLSSGESYSQSDVAGYKRMCDSAGGWLLNEIVSCLADAANLVELSGPIREGMHVLDAFQPDGPLAKVIITDDTGMAGPGGASLGSVKLIAKPEWQDEITEQKRAAFYAALRSFPIGAMVDGTGYVRGLSQTSTPENWRPRMQSAFGMLLKKTMEPGSPLQTVKP